MDSTHRTDADGWDDDYRSLIVAVRDSLHVLLVASSPDSWMSLRSAYGVLDRALEQTAPVAPAPTPREVLYEAKRPSVDWKQIPAERREAILFQVLGDNALTPREITKAINVELATPGEEDRWRVVYETAVKSLLNRMMLSGRLTRTPEPFKGKFRYRYSISRTLDGPIADLERAYRDDDSRAGGS
jgi:hypothetical protein